ncbi:MAG: Rid family detoxifying hydrolase, partial [Psychrobacter sp.]
MTRQTIQTDKAPAAVGTYSQAVKVGNTVYISGQLGFDPDTMELREGFKAQAEQVFENIKAICEAAGGSLNDVVKFNVSLTDLSDFAVLNEVFV